MKLAPRRVIAPAAAALFLSLALGGCGSHKDDSTPALHGAGSSNNDPSPAPVVDTGVHGTTTSGSPSGTTGGSTSTRATPGSANGFIPDSSGGGIDGIFPTSKP